MKPSLVVGGHASGSIDAWLESLRGGGEIGTLLGPRVEEQLALGYGHTLREIAQQPVTWLETAALVARHADAISGALEGASAVVLTGSGSSVYAAECAAPSLQQRLGVPAMAVPAGHILTHPEQCLPPSGRLVVVSLARSGNSPESRAVVEGLLESRPQTRHLFLTCNREGALATAYREAEGVVSLVLDEATHDKSLVMTSSFTNLVLAAQGLAATHPAERLEGRVREVAAAAGDLLRNRSDDVARLARGDFSSAVYLGSGCRLGVARESALKMLEMNAGRWGTMAESFLGLRHGPMSALREDTLVVAFLSSQPVVRAYETDLLRELEGKGLGSARVVVGAGVPPELAARPGDVIVDGPPGGGDEELVLLDAVVGQLLAFFRCRAGGLRPDAPSEKGVITRVVSPFAIHGARRS